uniref:Putative secreted protein n=1 Tax=Ixodes ricinus TaxID=34613 RepID=A0A6B0UF89_IXORI
MLVSGGTVFALCLGSVVPMIHQHDGAFCIGEHKRVAKFRREVSTLQASCSDDGMFVKPAGTDTFWHLLFSSEPGSVDAAFMISNKPVNKYPMFCSIF